MAYDRSAAVSYAHKWAFGRNKRYLDFHGIGGDCTNFISQCFYAGGAKMDYEKTFGWYYNSANDRAPAWTGVQYLYNYLMKKKEKGLYGVKIAMEELQPGDLIQLSFSKSIFSHSLIVVELKQEKTPDTILIATHTDDSDYRPLSTYQAIDRRYIRIDVK